MSFHFKPAKREGVNVILGFMGGTGSGKTWSALEIATGLAGGKPFAVIDTEAGRALQYADYFDFQHGSLEAPFSPSRYLEAVLAAQEAGYPVAVVDSFSHEHAGDGGILDMHDAELDRLTKGNPSQRDRYKMLGWVKPKTEHKRMVNKLLQLRMHLVLCFRAEPKVKPIKVEGKTKIVDLGWQPIAAKGLDFEMAASFMLRNEHPGQVTTGRIDQMDPTGHPIKLPEPLKEIFKGTYLLNRTHGEALAKWAAGDPDEPKEPKSDSKTGPDQELLNPAAVKAIRDRFFQWQARQELDSTYPETIVAALKEFGTGVETVAELTTERGKDFADWITTTGRKARKAKS